MEQKDLEKSCIAINTDFLLMLRSFLEGITRNLNDKFYVLKATDAHRDNQSYCMLSVIICASQSISDAIRLIDIAIGESNGE